MNVDSLKQKLALGTVQLGLQYGINNQTGKPDEAEAFNILDLASREKISILDSAEAYGDSLSVIGNYLKRGQKNSFQVISKFIGNGMSLTNRVDDTLKTLGCSNLYAYMFHRFSDYQAGKYVQELVELKGSGKIQRIGVSLYSLAELEAVVHDPLIDIFQLPFNPFHASAQKKEFLKEARASGKEVHIRSVFLQGLFFKQPEELTGNLTSFHDPLHEFQQRIKTYGLSVRQACLNFALHDSEIDRIVIGVETRQQLEENIQAILPSLPNKLSADLQLSIDDEAMLNPSNWKL